MSMVAFVAGQMSSRHWHSVLVLSCLAALFSGAWWSMGKAVCPMSYSCYAPNSSLLWPWLAARRSPASLALTSDRKNNDHDDGITLFSTLLRATNVPADGTPEDHFLPPFG